MDIITAETAVHHRSVVRIKDTSVFAAGRTGIALGYHDSYDTIKVGFVDESGMYTGEFTTVARSMVELDTEEVSEPAEGMGASFVYGSDREPGTIVDVKRFKSGARKGQVRQIVVRFDQARVVSGNFQSNNAVIEYIDGNGEFTVPCTQDSRGVWRMVGRGTKVLVGVREYYQDPHF